MLSAPQMSDHGGSIDHLEAGTVAAYLDRGLLPAQMAAVEAHLAECAACRAEVVLLDGLARPGRTRRRFHVAGIVIAAAAASLLFFLSPGTLGLPGGPTSPAGTDALAARVRALGAVAQPPIYLGVSVRAETARGTDLFTAGMRAYVDAKYPNAVASLRGARAAGIEGAATPFFVGASLLVLNDASGAAEEFARVIGLGGTPYLAEAHYYRAKALLRLNRPSDAAGELDRAIQSGVDPIKGAALSLRDSLRVLRQP